MSLLIRAASYLYNDTGFVKNKQIKQCTPLIAQYKSRDACEVKAVLIQRFFHSKSVCASGGKLCSRLSGGDGGAGCLKVETFSEIE